jgi:NAD-dependent DNA ligase
MLTNTQIEELYTKTDSISKDEYINMLRCLDNIYYNKGNITEYILPDEYYDLLLEKFENRFGEPYEYIGSDVISKEIVKLPFYLGSMNKYKPESKKDINKWILTYKSPYIIESKLDGVSALYYNNNLYTRGNGYEGTLISNLIPYLKLPKIDEGIAIRGEIIMKLNVFEKKYSEKYKNPRNLVSGIVNSKTLNKTIANNLDFVAYEIIEPIELEPSQQLKLLKKLGFKVVKNTKIDKIDIITLEKLLDNFRDESEYEIDGIIVQSDNSYIRNTTSNPDYAFAFKKLRNLATTNVVRVEWNVRRYGLLKPVVIVDPVDISGVTITRTTGFNAKYIKDNKIGPGTLIEITRSGDVIPFIVSIVSSTYADMPNNIDYTWNSTGVDIVTKDITTERTVNIILHFFTTLKIKGVAEKTIEKFVNSGYDTIDKIINISKKELEEIGFGKKESDNIYNSIHKNLEVVDLSLLMSATPYFGFGLGYKKIKLVINKYPKILDMKFNEDLISDISNIEGWSYVSAKQYVDGLQKFKDFLQRNNIIGMEEQEKFETPSKKRFIDMKIVFTGFRNKDWEKIIESEGGKVTTTVSKQTNLIITTSLDENSSKLNKGKELGIKILSKEQFEKQYYL